jgi:hypothetical protein
MISFHHSFSTRIFLNNTTSPEREARRAQAAAAIARARDEPRTPNELREFWWFLRGDEGAGKGKSPEGRAPARTRPTLQDRGDHA